MNTPPLRDAKIFPDASVELVYLDPPFNSNADYNVLLRRLDTFRRIIVGVVHPFGDAVTIHVHGGAGRSADR